MLGSQVADAVHDERRLEPLAQTALAGAPVALRLVTPEMQIFDGGAGLDQRS
jgi:hypothetical protein